MVICHFVFALGLALPLGLASPHPVAPQARSTRARITWGAIGDSWGSGVSYDILGRTDYDGNKDQCLRINHAYSVQVHQDQSWVPENKVQDFSFAACSGARLVNMAAEPFNGYAHFFNVDDGSSWCNDPTFSLGWNTQAQPQKLLLGLRRNINDLVEILNLQIQRAVNDFKDRGVGYIDITKGFDGGRFCETHHTLLDQCWGNNVMLWNASPEGVVLNINGNYLVRDPTEDEMKNWLQTGKFKNDPSEV
ncbi:putative SGNH hydrolase-type esterase domain-containing protein [Seiridium cardinale]|uniref:SGNH hydrolase-type esterase domain-containing protein n=1 Tax=Seiridium cardinale TaxID=138064 RepID=A0ABR2X9D9_9PEZI